MQFTNDQSKPRLIDLFARTLLARDNARATQNMEWAMRHGETLRKLEALLPSGSGLDNGVRLHGDSNERCVKFQADFHHMNEGGFYDGWTEHIVRVRPSFVHRMDISVGGRNRGGIKEYLLDTFYDVLSNRVTDEDEVS